MANAGVLYCLASAAGFGAMGIFGKLAYDEGATVVEPWDVHLDSAHAHEVLALLAPQQRLALTLRYLDGLPVVQVASELGRTLHATETLLVRSRAAFRRAYEEGAEA